MSDNNKYIRQIAVTQLEIGAYVCELDKPWADTPFLFQGFAIEKDEQIDEVKKHCHHVYIDLEKTKFYPNSRLNNLKNGGKIRIEEERKSRPAIGNIIQSNFEHAPEVTYKNSVTFEQEVKSAYAAHESMQTLTTNIISDIEDGKTINYAEVKETTAQMVESIIRNPDALIWLNILKKQNAYAYNHAINVSTYMLAFSRHLGFPKEEMIILGMAGLLMDVGKTKISKLILEKKGGLTQKEKDIMKKHVELGVDIVSKIPGIPEDVIKIIYSHHERYNGSGYPRGLSCERINLYSSIAGIVDCYDAMTSDTNHSEPLSSYEALQQLNEERDISFQGAFTEQFLQCIGVYAVGSVVELNSGEIAVVTSQNRAMRLKPKLMLFLDSNKQPLKISTTLDLAQDPKFNANEDYVITKVLEPGTYGIDPRDCFL